MADFKESLWSGTEPLYAPCTGTTGTSVFWKCPRKYRNAGYAVTSKRLTGNVGDGKDERRAAEARELTREMIRWYEGAGTKVAPGTWGGLIARYKADDISPFQEVQPNTRVSYLYDIAYWEDVLGSEMVEAFDFPEAKRIQREMKKRGRSPRFIKGKFTMLRIVVGYGVAIKWPGAKVVKDLLGELRTETPKPRTSSPTSSQIMGIIEAADAGGDHAFALGILIQWRLALRAMDVRGDWFLLDRHEDRSGICRGNQRWGKGLTWDMIDRDVTTLTKAPSKTDRSAPDAIEWDLTLVPDLRARLQSITNRVGPVIVDKAGMPYSRFTWQKLWAKYREKAGVPETIWMMDTRAGAANDAEERGASAIDLNKQLTHASMETTKRYIREKSKGVNNVLRIRAEQS